jgi:catechol 2,3-dioxygenase-like lactoylglutathione lyase family enzyme
MQHREEDTMLQITEAFCSFAVGDLAAATDFYGTTLGLRVSTALPDGAGPLWVRVANERGILVYSKPDHVPASFTVLNLEVDDIERAADDLKARGVTFERYPEYPQDARGIYHGEGHSIAWFKDPAGNGLCIVQTQTAA